MTKWRMAKYRFATRLELYLTTHFPWARRVSNQRPLACEARPKEAQRAQKAPQMSIYLLK